MRKFNATLGLAALVGAVAAVVCVAVSSLGPLTLVGLTLAAVNAWVACDSLTAAVRGR